MEGEKKWAKNVYEHHASGKSRVQLQHIDGHGMSLLKFPHDKIEYVI